MLSFTIAFRNMKRRKGRAITSIVVVAIAVSLLVGIGISNATAIDTFKARFTETFANRDIIIRNKLTNYFNVSEIAFLYDIDGINISLMLFDTVIVRSEYNDTAAIIIGLEPDSYYYDDLDIVGDRNINESSIVVTESLMDVLNVSLNENITLFTLSYNISSFKIIGIDNTTYKGVFGGEAPAYRVFMELSTAQSFTNHTQEISMVYVDVSDPNRIEEVISEIENQLGEEYEVIAPIKQYLSIVDNAVSGFSLGLTFFSLFISGLGVILIANSMFMNVEERKQEIGITRALGFTKFQIFKMTLIETISYGIIGSIFGIGLGIFISYSLVQLYLTMFGITDVAIALIIDMNSITNGIVLGIITTVVSGIIPAIQATKVTIVEAIRGYALRATKVRLYLYIIVGIGLIIMNALTPIIKFDIPFSRAIGLVVIAGAILKKFEVPISRMFKSLFGPAGIIGSRMAIRHLRRTVLTIAILTFTISFAVGIAGTQQAWDRAINKLPETVFSFDIIVHSETPLSWDFKDNISKVEGVNLAIGLGTQQTDINATNITTGIIIVDFKDFSKVMNLELLNGSYNEINDESIAIFEKFANTLNVTYGDNLTLLTVEGYHNFTISAIFKSTGFEDFTYFADSSLGRSIYINRDAARKYYGFEDKTNYYMVLVEEDASRQEVSERIKNSFKSYHLETISVDDIITQVKSISNQIFILFYIIIAVGLIIGGFGIFIGAAQTVIQQRYDFGVLRSQGFGNWDIAMIIFSESFLIGIVSFILALIDLPFSLKEAVEASSSAAGIIRLEYIFPWMALVQYFVIILLIVALGSVKPIRDTLKLNIVEILRQE